MRLCYNLRASFNALAPLIIGMLPFAIAFGAFSVSAGIPGEYSILMSATVYAGLAQFIVVNMVSNGIDNLFLLIGLVLLVNMRFSLMGLSLKPHYPPRSRWIDCILSFGLSDEPYIAVMHRFSSQQYSLSFHAWSYFLVYFFWVAGTAMGVYLSSVITDPHALGLDFAMCAAFTVMLIPRLKEKDSLAAAVLSSLGTLVLYEFDLGEAAIVIASLGSLLAVSFFKRKKIPTSYNNGT